MTTDCLNEPETFSRYYHEMSAGRRGKIDRARMEQDKKLSLAAGILLDRGLRDFMKLREKEVRIQEGPYGKPFLPDFPEIHFSLSHSREMALAVFGDTEVGCDIEYRKNPEEAPHPVRLAAANEKLAGRFFCPEETAWMLAAREEKERQERFYRLWTLKESFVKATGQGLRLPLDSFCFRIEEAPGADETARRAGAVSVSQHFDEARYEFEEYQLGRDGEYCAAVCLRRSTGGPSAETF